MAEDNSLLPSVVIILQQSLLYVTQQFLVVTSKVKRNCDYTCQQSLCMRAWERGCNFYTIPLISLHFLLLIGFYFSNDSKFSNALRNLCCASVILSIHTHILGPCMGREYILCKGHAINKGVFFSHASIHYLTIICTYCLPCTFLTLAFSAFEQNGSHTSQQSLLALNIL